MLRCFLRRLFRRFRLIGRPVFLHTLGKLADVVQIAADFGMVFINEAAGILPFLSPRGCDNDLSAVWDTEQFFILRVNKSDTLFCFLDMLIKPFLHITIAVKIIVAFGGIAPKQKSVFLRIHTETVLRTIVTLDSTFGKMPCKRTHIIAVMQKPFILP